jgi:hypothetical protein
MEGAVLYVALFANWFLAGIAGGAAAIGVGLTMRLRLNEGMSRARYARDRGAGMCES